MKQKLLHSFTLRVCLLVAMFASAVSGAWADTSTLTFTAKCNGSGTADDGVAWTVASDGTESTFDSTKGIHYGTNNAQVQYITLSTSSITGTITSIVVNASSASGVSASLNVTVGGNAFGTQAQTVSTTATNYTFNGSASGAIVVTLTKPTKAAKAIYVKSIAVTYTTGGDSGDQSVATTTTINATGITNTDVYSGTTAGSLSATVKDNENAVISAATVTWSGDNDDVATIDASGNVTLVAAGTVTFTASYEGVTNTYKASSATYEMTVTDSTPIPTHTATFSVNGVTTTDDVEEGAEITFPADPADQEGKVFLGWTTSAIEGTTNEAPTMVTSATMGNADVTYYAVFANRIAGTLVEVTDELTNSNTINDNTTSYTTWTSNGTSGAVYAGQSAGSDNTIQLRSNNSNSGIVTTTSGGKATKITVEWNSATGSDRVLNIYGKGSAYESPANLYSGDPIGTIDRNSTTFTLPYNYAYIGIRSASGALYLDKVSITWSNGGTPDSYSDYCTTVAADTRDEAGISFANTIVTKGTGDSYTGEVLTNPNSLTVSYTSSNEEVATVNASTGEVTLVGPGETTITASFAGNESYKAGSASYTLNVKDDAVIVVQDEDVVYGSTFTIDDSMIEGGDITVTSSNTAVATVSGLTITPVAVGTTTITVATAENATYLAGSETFELTVTAPEGKTTAAAATETVFEETFAGCEGTGGNDDSWSGTIASSSLNADNKGWTFTNGSGASACAKFGASSKKGSATTPALGKSGTLTLSFKAAAWDGSSEGTTLNLSVSEGTISESSVTLTKGEFNTFTATITDATASTTITFEAENASNNRFFLDDVVVTTEGASLTATLNATTGYATYCSEYPLDFSDDSEFSAWEITEIEGTTITFNQITGTVKGGTGVFLKGTAGETVTLTSADSNNTLSDNLLEGIMAPTYVAAGDFFGLKGNEFVPVNAGTVPAGKALLPAIEVPNNVKAFTFVFVNTATGMRTVETVSAEDAKAIFNLAGQRLSKTQRGINIVNGKKVVVK